MDSERNDRQGPDLEEAAKTAAAFIDGLESPELYRLALEFKHAATAYVEAAVEVPGLTPGMVISSALGIVVRAAGID